MSHSPLAQTWTLIVGAALGAITLLFLMILVLLGAFGREVPCNSTYLVNSVLSFGAAMSAAFLGGNAAARGSIGLPFLRDNPIAMSVSGGIAVLVIMLVLTSQVFGGRNCEASLSVSCPAGSQAHIVDPLRFGFCYPREGWEVDTGAVGIRAADIYVRRSENRDVGVHFHVSLIPAGWAGRPTDYTTEVGKTWRQLDPDLELSREFISGRDVFKFALKVKDRKGNVRPTEVRHIYLDKERLLEVIATWFDDTPPAWINDIQRTISSLEIARV